VLDMARVREVFDASDDFTVGIEEEFAIVDPETHALTQRFDELHEAAAPDSVLSVAVAGELIASEIEIRSEKGTRFADALDSQREARARLFGLAADCGVLLGATGAHPWSPWQEQQIIDTEHYRLLDQHLGYVAWRNNTFSVQVHVGIRGADRAIAVCDRLRAVLPDLLAVSANSPFLDGRDSRLASARSQLFTRSFPRCGVPDVFGDFSAYADYVDLLARTRSITEFTQLWWSVRPHHRFGTIEVRMCDAQTSAEDSTALAGLMAACVAQAALDHDEDAGPPPAPARLIEENMWRAIRNGAGASMIDLERGEELPGGATAERLLEWTAPARAELGIDFDLPREDGATRQRRALEGGATIEEVYAAEVAETQRTYQSEGVTT
jgi:carboxylate-amine ligase